MNSIGAMLAGKHGDDGEPDPEDDESRSGEPHEMAEAAVKAFFEAGQQGDYASAAEHLATAMEHCDSMLDGGGGDGDKGSSGHALLIMPKGK